MDFIDPVASLPSEVLVFENDADVLAAAEAVRGAGSVALQFPKWTDGRAYSQAVLLRGRLRFAGRLIAIGGVLADMLPLLQRCGFDAVRLRGDQKPETARRGLVLLDSHGAAHYQLSAAERSAAAEAGTRPRP